MKTLADVMRRDELNVIGLMSGTSADGIDAALTRIEAREGGIKVTCLGFVSLPYTPDERGEILRLAEGGAGGSRDLCLFSFWLGHRSLEACRAVCREAGIRPDEVDLVGSHGQTLYHIPEPAPYLGGRYAGTLQLGEASVVAEGLGCPVVSDFRVRDVAAGGQGAPLVPYAEYLIYRDAHAHVALQNIGGIGNLTLLPAGAPLESVLAFDTGPGNMVIDQLAFRLSGGRMRWDEGGEMAARGRVSCALLERMLDDPYLRKAPPKTTGRERYGAAYVDALLARAEALGLGSDDVIATATRFTAECVGRAIDFCPCRPQKLIVGGGGVYNRTLMRFLAARVGVPVLTNEQLGLRSDAKEAVAFAVLAHACVRGQVNNVPGATGAAHPVVLGKISQ